MKVTLDRKDIEDAVKMYIRDRFYGMEHEGMTVVQGKVALAVVTLKDNKPVEHIEDDIGVEDHG